MRPEDKEDDYIEDKENEEIEDINSDTQDNETTEEEANTIPTIKSRGKGIHVSRPIICLGCTKTGS